MDGWKLHKEFSELTGFTWIIDIEDHFSKFIKSFPVETNNAINTLAAFKQFCIMIETPRIFQTYNNREYKSNLFEEYFLNNNIKYNKKKCFIILWGTSKKF